MFGLSARQWGLLLLLTAVLYVGAKVVPVYVDAFQFNDYIRQEVKFASANRRTSDGLRARIVEKAPEYGIAIGPKDVVIQRRGPVFTLVIDYIIPLDLRFYQREISFHISETGEMLDQ
jgi:hypothetical protein